MRASAAGGPAGAHPFSSVADIVCKGEQDGPGSFTVETSSIQQSGLAAAGSLAVRSTGEPILAPTLAVGLLASAAATADTPCTRRGATAKCWAH